MFTCRKWHNVCYFFYWHKLLDNFQLAFQKQKVIYGQEPQSGESTTTECGVNYQLLAVIYWSAQWVIPIVTVDHNQLRTIASETADPIDWSHPPLSWAVPVPPQLHVLHGVNAAYKSQDLLHQPGLEHEATGMPDHSELDDSSILFYCSRNNSLTAKQNTL